MHELKVIKHCETQTRLNLQKKNAFTVIAAENIASSHAFLRSDNGSVA